MIWVIESESSTMQIEQRIAHLRWCVRPRRHSAFLCWSPNVYPPIPPPVPLPFSPLASQLLDLTMCFYWLWPLPPGTLLLYSELSDLTNSWDYWQHEPKSYMSHSSLIPYLSACGKELSQSFHTMKAKRTPCIWWIDQLYLFCQTCISRQGFNDIMPPELQAR